jgi:hypothetical protein
MRNRIRRSNAALILLIGLFCSLRIAAQTTEFSYQGRLTDGGVAANGSYDMRFRLFDAPSGGTEFGAPVLMANVHATAGVFSVSIDFGASAFALMSEFEQARGFKNISLFLPTGRNFELLDLREICFHRLPVALSFYVQGTRGNTTIRRLTLVSRNASILSPPLKKSDGARGQDAWRVNFSLPDSQLLHAFGQEGGLVEENL